MLSNAFLMATREGWVGYIMLESGVIHGMEFICRNIYVWERTNESFAIYCLFDFHFAIVLYLVFCLK